MTHVRLEIDKVMIFSEKERWRLYFVIFTEHPTDSEKMILTTIPQQPILLTGRHQNSFSFSADQEGADGLLVLSREMPENREINVHVYLRHTRERHRNIGAILNDLKSEIGVDAFEIVTDLVGTATTPWLVITKKAIPMIGKILMKIPDKDFGFLSAFERFGPEFEEQTEISYTKDFSGNAALVYSWSVEK
jgi:hypothetical protein